MRVKGSYSPPPYEIETVGESVIVRFYENVEEVNEVDEVGGTAYIGYEYDRYSTKLPYDEGLPSRVAANAAGWLEKLKEDERSRLEAEVLSTRARLLADVDWTALNDVPLAPEKLAEYRAYRQALRDVDKKHVATWPYGVAWPVKPA